MKWDSAMRRYFIFRGLLSRVYLPILAIYMVDRGLSLSQIAFIMVASQVVSLVCEVPSGAIADTIGHRRALVISLFGQAASALLYLGGTFPWILAASAAYWGLGSLMSGTSEAMFFEYCKSTGREHEHLKLWGEGKAFSRLFNMLAVSVGGVSYTIHPLLPFILCALQFSAAGILISTFPTVKHSESVEKQEGFMELLQHFPRAVKIIWHHPYVFWLVVLNALLMGIIAGTNDFQQIIFTGLGATATFVGLVYGMKRLVSMTLNSYAHKLARFGAAKIMSMGTFLIVSYALLTPHVQSYFLYTLLVLQASVVYATLEVLFNDWLNHAIPSLSRATTLSIANFASTGIGILSATLFGVLDQPPQFTFPVLGACILALAIVPLVQLSRGKAEAGAH